MRLKDITILNPTYNGMPLDKQVSFVPMESLRYDMLDLQEIAFDEGKGKYTYFADNDLLIAKVTPCFENGNIAIAKNLKENIGFGSSEIFILRPNKKISSRYMFYYVQTNDFRNNACATMCGVGGLKRISPLFMRTYELDIPSLQVQQRIVEYLDAKTTEIDNKIELLGKKRDAYNRLTTATINHAVTRGLDEHVKLKDSSIDWIGQIPEHWVSYRLKDICEFRNGYTPSKGVEEFWKDGTIPWYRMEDIRISGRILKEAQQYITEEAIKTGGLFEADSFIVATTATIGEHARLIADSLANQRFTNLKIRKSLNNIISTDYFFYFLYIVDNFCKINYHFSTFPAVDMFLLRAMPINLPPLEEQKQIAAYLDDRCAKIDAAVTIIDKQIDALKRLKRSLINEVVTGKRTI